MKQFFCIAMLFLLPLTAHTQTIRSLGNPLVDAADQGIETLVAAHIKNGNNVNVRGDFGITPLMRAAYHNYTNIMEMLINMGADVNLADEGGATALHLAARQGNVEAVNLLIKYDAVLDMADAEGWTPLMRATAGERKDVARVLIEAGADVETKNEWGESALILAEKSPELLQFMQQESSAQKQKITAVEAARQDIPVPVEQVLPSDLPPSGSGAVASVAPTAPPAPVNTASEEIVEDVVLPEPKVTIPEAGVKLLKEAEQKMLEQQGYLKDVFQRNILKDQLAEAKAAREKAELQLQALQAERQRQEAEAKLLAEQKAFEEAQRQAELLAQQRAAEEAALLQAQAEEQERQRLLAEQQAIELQRQMEIAAQEKRAKEAAILQAQADAAALEQARARMMAERQAAEEAERQAAQLAQENAKRNAQLAEARALHAKQQEIAQRNAALIEKKAMEIALAREQKARAETEAKLQSELAYQQQQKPTMQPPQQLAAASPPEVFIGEAISVPVSSSPVVTSYHVNPKPNLLAMNKGVWLQVGPFGEEPEAIAYYDRVTETMQELPRRMKIIASAFLMDSPPQNFLRVGPYTSQKVAEVACGFFRTGDLLCEYVKEQNERVRIRL